MPLSDFATALHAHASRLIALAPPAAQWHSAAHYDEASLTLLSVEPVPGSADTYTLHYTLTWHAQLGCSDVAHTGTEALSTRFTYRAGQLLFPAPSPVPDRTTVEEF